MKKKKTEILWFDSGECFYFISINSGIEQNHQNYLPLPHHAHKNFQFDQSDLMSDEIVSTKG